MIKRYIEKKEENITNEIGEYCGYISPYQAKGIVLKTYSNEYFWCDADGTYQLSVARAYQSIEDLMNDNKNCTFYFADSIKELFRWLGEE